MLGLEVSRRFFFEWGLPWLRRERLDLNGRIAAGRLRGSDVLAADDDISRDHSWGPHFWIFLTADDYATHGAALERQMNADAPDEWLGYRLRGGGDRSVIVASIAHYCRDDFGLGAPPQTPRDWVPAHLPSALALPAESNLYFFRHGEVFLDEPGELTGWRAALHRYPRDIWLRRVAEEVFRIWHHGEYNFVQRMTRRRDALAIHICLGEFVQGVMRLIMLLDGDFTPYWKWLAHEFRKHREASLLEQELMRLTMSRDLNEQAAVVNGVCAAIHQRLLNAGLVSTDGPQRQPFLLPLLNDRIEVTEQIADDFWRP